MSSTAPKTLKLETTHLNEPRRPVMAERDDPKTGLMAPPWRLLMQIGGDTQTTVGLEVRDLITIGRTDPVADFHPDLDLVPYGGQENGVSRRHLIIAQNEKKLFVQDLNTTNGSRINGYQLAPQELYRLRDGDELELGRVRIVVRFVRSPY